MPIAKLALAALLLAVQASAIGVRQLEIRLPAGESARVTLWYPSASSGQPVRMSDYLHMDSHKGDLGEVVAALIAKDPATVPAEMRAEALTTRFRAVRDARPRAGRYPLVLWSVRHGTVAGQAYLSEALARAGFAVATVEPLAWKPTSVRDEVRKHVALLEQSIGQLAKLPQINASRLAVIGWSYGGESAVQLAARNPSVALLVGLSPDPFPKDIKLQVPVLWFDERVPPESGNADIHHIRLSGTRQGCFNTVEGWVASRVGVKAPQPWSLASPVCAKAYEHTAEIVVRNAVHYLRTARAGANEP
ncbi:MAG: dienelactone hydrolase family protein [Bryobacteraceae bacterium]